MIKILKKIMTVAVACVSLILCSCGGNSSDYTVTFTDGNSITLQVGGEAVKLDVNVSSKTHKRFDDTLIWSSGDTNIVEVDDNGYVVGCAEGQTYVTVSLAIDPNAKATCSIVVEPNDNHFIVNPAKVQLNLYSLALKTTYLSVLKDGAEYTNVTWSSNDRNIATVSSAGKVTAKEEGSTFITAKDKMSSYSATCFVTVVDSSAKVTGITIEPESLSLDAFNNKTATLVANVSGTNNYSKEVNWTSSDSSIAAINTTGLVTAISEGTCTIKATSIADTSVYDECIVEVTDSAPIEVVLNKTNLSLNPGKSRHLTATVLHSRNQDVIWSGSENGINVDSDGNVSIDVDAYIDSIATIVATSVEDQTKSASCVVTVVSTPVFDTDYTIMFYMCASTLEYDSSSDDPWSWGGHNYGYGSETDIGLFSCDILEMLSVKNIPDEVKIIIETGGTGKWLMPSKALDGATKISESRLQRWIITPSSSYSVTDPYLEENVTCYNKLKLVETLNTNQMGSKSSFQSFLEWGLKDYSSEQMGVVISGHGGGVDGCAYDDNYDENSLQAGEVGEAAKNALQAYDREKFTWIGYDCCLMSVADVASINSDYFEYMVASQESENGTGWNHDVYLQELIADTDIEPTKFLPAIVSAFHDDNCTTSYCKKSEGYCQQTLSVLDLSKMDSFVTAFNEFASSYGTDRTTFNTYKDIMINCVEFGENCYGLLDAKHFLTLCNQKKSNSKINEVLGIIDEMVIANEYCSRYSYASKPCGLNIFLAYSYDKDYGLQVYKTNYSSSDTKLTSWQSMNYSYGSYY